MKTKIAKKFLFAGEINFSINEREFTAKWSHLVKLYDLEHASTELNDGVRGLSKLTDVAVRPKPVERQKVSTCLQVFCDETCSALRTHPKLDKAEVQGTALFIQRIVDTWKILNVSNLVPCVLSAF